MKLFTISHSGLLTQYCLKPHGPEQPSPGAYRISKQFEETSSCLLATLEEDPKTLHLTIEPTFYWDLGRRSSASQSLTKLRGGKVSTPQGDSYKTNYFVRMPKVFANI